MAGKTKRSGDWGKEEHIRAQLNIEQQQFSQPTKEITNARPRGLRIWYSTQYQHSKYALFFPCNVFLIFSNFSLLLNLIHMHRYIQNMQYALCNLFHKLFNLALHCLYLFIRILCYPSIALIVISQCIPPNCSILNLYSVPLS